MVEALASCYNNMGNAYKETKQWQKAQVILTSFYGIGLKLMDLCLSLLVSHYQHVALFRMHYVSH